MPEPWSLLEPAIGPIDGSNRNFETANNYKPGTLKLWWDGVLLKSDWDDGFVETGVKSFRTNQAPPTGTKLAVYYDIAI